MARSNVKARAALYNSIISDDGDVLEIDVYSVVGEDWWSGNGTSALDVRSALKRFGGSKVALRINSLGGDVFDGVAIYNLLRDASKKGKSVTVDIDGIAASAASIVACGGDVIRVAKNAMLMIHNAWTFTAGNANDMREQADVLDKVDQQLAVTYQDTVARIGADTTMETLRELMDAETWLTGAEALELGLVTEVVEASDNPDTYARTVASVVGLPNSLREKWVAKAATLRGEPSEQRAAGLRSMVGLPASAVNMPTTVEVHVNGTAEYERVAEAVRAAIITPAPGGEASEENTMGMNELLARLGAKDEADAFRILDENDKSIAAAIVDVDFSKGVVALTGKSGDEGLGIVAAWKANSENLPEIKAERDAAKAELDVIKKAKADAERAAVLKQIADEGKATKAELELMAGDGTDENPGQSIGFLRSWAATATARIPESTSDPEGQVTEPEKPRSALSATDKAYCKRYGIDEADFAAHKAEQAAAQGDADDDDDEG